jgi:hypothetical protein
VFTFSYIILWMGYGVLSAYSQVHALSTCGGVVSYLAFELSCGKRMKSKCMLKSIFIVLKGSTSDAKSDIWYIFNTPMSFVMQIGFCIKKYVK